MIRGKILALIGLTIGFSYDLLSMLNAFMEFNFPIFNETFDIVFDLIEYFSMIYYLYLEDIFSLRSLTVILSKYLRGIKAIMATALLLLAFIIIVMKESLLPITSRSLIVFILYIVFFLFTPYFLQQINHTNIIPLINELKNMLFFRRTYICMYKIIERGDFNQDKINAISDLEAINVYLLITLFYLTLFFVSAYIQLFFDLVFSPVLLLTIFLFKALKLRSDLEISFLKKIIHPETDRKMPNMAKYGLIFSFSLLMLLTSSYMFELLEAMLELYWFGIFKIQLFMVFSAIMVYFVVKYILALSLMLFIFKKSSFNIIDLSIGSIVNNLLLYSLLKIPVNIIEISNIISINSILVIMNSVVALLYSWFRRRKTYGFNHVLVAAALSYYSDFIILGWHGLGRVGNMIMAGLLFILYIVFRDTYGKTLDQKIIEGIRRGGASCRKATYYHVIKILFDIAIFIFIFSMFLDIIYNTFVFLVFASFVLFMMFFILPFIRAEYKLCLMGIKYPECYENFIA